MGYSPTYLKTINNQLSAIFNYAVRYYDLKSNPCAKAGSMGKSKAEEMDFWTGEEFRRFIDSVMNKRLSYMAFMTLYWTGMRLGELLALNPKDVDLEKRTIAITKSYQRLGKKDVITPPKTSKSKRVITILEFLAADIKDYMDSLPMYEEILTAAQMSKKEGKGYRYPVMGHLVGITMSTRGDRKKLNAMAGY